MDQLEYGDLVLSRSLDGNVQWKPVYLFGHRMSIVRDYVALHTSSKRLQLTDHHYAKVCISGCMPEALANGGTILEARWAVDVRVGDVLLTCSEDHSQCVDFEEVVAVGLSYEIGKYNPLVRGADLIVDGVVVSPHTAWLLEGLAVKYMPAAAPWLPRINEAALTPVWLLSLVVAPSTQSWLAEDVFQVHGDEAHGKVSAWMMFNVACLGVMKTVTTVTKLGYRGLIK